MPSEIFAMMQPLGTLLRCADIGERRIAFYREIGLNAIQIAGVYEEWLAPEPEARRKSDEIFALLRNFGFAAPGLFLSYPGQVWSDHSTIGLVPEKTRAERMILSCRQMEWAKRYGIRFITCHVGFLPEAQEDFRRFLADMKQLVRFAAACGQEFLFETGTETAARLKQTIDGLGEPNVGINFDPANLLIYGMDDPAKSAELLADRIRIVHCKDAVPAAPGEGSGKETVLGQGATRFAELLKKLLKDGFAGPLVIERELTPGPEQEKDIAEAVKYIRSIAEDHETGCRS